MMDRRFAGAACAVYLASACQARDHPAPQSDSDRRRHALAAVCRSGDYGPERRRETLTLFREVVRTTQDPLRPMAFDALACLGRWSDVPELVPVLHDTSEQVGIRMRAAQALEPATAAGERALTQVVDDAQAPLQLRLEALATLGHGCTSAATVVTRALQLEPPLRAAAVQSLAALGEVDALAAATRHAEADVRLAAVAALGTLRPQATSSLSALAAALRDPATRPAATTALVAIGPASVAVFVEAVASSDEQVRLAAADGLARRREGAKAALPALQAMARGDASEGAREVAARALREIGPSFAELAAQLEASDEMTRTRALAGITIAIMPGGPGGKLGASAEEVVPALRRRLADPVASIRGDAMATLGYAEAVEAVPDVLHRLQNDESAHVRGVAALTLGRLYGKLESPEARASVVAALRKAQGDADPFLKQTVEQALREVSYTPQAQGAPAARCANAS